MRALTLFMVIFPVFINASLSSSNEPFDSHPLPRPLNLGHSDGVEGRENDEVLKCTSWRVAVEANNMNPWKTVPQECGDYVKDYVTGKSYKMDLERVSDEAAVFANSVELQDDGKNAWVFDIDETLFSHLPYYAEHGYGLEMFDSVEFDKWVEKGLAPAIESSLRLYEEVLGLGFKVFLLTGRNERYRDITVQNLKEVGFKNWDRLILRAAEDQGKLATVFKSEKRNEMVKEGFRILGNSGDQWSDLLGSSMSARSFKLPNPMYHIP